MRWLARMIRDWRWLGMSYGRYYEVASILAFVALVSALLTTAYLATEKVSSDQAVAAMQKMRDQFADQVQRMTNSQHPDYEWQPGYKVRIAQKQLESADKLFKRVKNDEKVLLDKIGQAATKDALINLIKGQIFTSDVTGAGNLAFDTTLKISDAYAKSESEYQKRLRQKIQDLKKKNQAGPLQDQDGLTRDDMDFLIAAAELDHIIKQMEREGYDRNDPAFVNQLNRYIEDFYLEKDETILPPNIRRWLETIRVVRFGGTVKETPTSTLEPTPTSTMVMATTTPTQTATATGSPTPKATPTSTKGPDLTATGQFILTGEAAAETDVKTNTMSLTFNPEGGPVNGNAHFVFLLPPDEGCKPSRADGSLTFTGTYSPDSQRFGGTGSGHATAVNHFYDSETKQCVSEQGEERFELEWEATLQGNKVIGTVTRIDSDSPPERFELTIQGQ